MFFVRASRQLEHIQIDASNMEAAEAILNQPIPESISIEGESDYEQPHCPSCGSLDGLIVAFRNAKICQTCGVQWQETDDI